MKRKFSMFLAALLLISNLAGCGKQTDDALAGQIVYVPEHISFTKRIQDFDDGCVSGNTAYLLGEADSGVRFQLQRIDLESGESEMLPDAPSDTSVLSTPSRLSASSDPNDPAYQDWRALSGTLRAGADGTIWMMERFGVSTYTQFTLEDEQFYILRNLDADGKELARFEYSNLEEKLELGWVSDLLVDSDGDVFAEAEKGVALLDETGEARFIIEEELLLGGELVRLSDGRAGMTHAVLSAPGEFTWSLHLIDKEAEKLGESWPLASDATSPIYAYDGDDSALFYYSIGDSLRSWREGDEESTQITNLLDAGIEEMGLGLRSVFSLTGEKLTLLSGDYYSGASLDILTATDASLVPDKKVLTFASLGLTTVHRDAIMAFNKSSSEYRISVTDYSQYGGREAALTRLATEVGAGKMPDIIHLYRIPVSRWAANGILEDLWPYIDSDPEISRDGLMERVFQAAEIDGKLYEIGSDFAMSTLTGLKSVVGNRMTWTMEDMWQALESMPEDCIPTGDSRTSMLRSLMNLDWSRFIDWNNSTCSFESEEFKSLLESCARFPADMRGSAERGVYEGRQMLNNSWISGFEAPQLEKFLLGGDISYVGYPNEWGEVGSSFFLVDNVAMSSACKDKEGAWAFLRTYLLPHDESELQPGAYNYFPVNKADFQKTAELAMTPEYQTYRDGTPVIGENGKPVERTKVSLVLSGITEYCDCYAATQEEYDQLMALYEAIDTYERWDDDLESIVLETAGAYFAGDKSLDEAAALIQNRASLYVNEQAK